MERLVILGEGEVIEVSDLPEKFQRLILPAPKEPGNFRSRASCLPMRWPPSNGT